MSIHQRAETGPASPNGGEVRLSEQLEALAAQYGNCFLLEPAPDHQLPEHGMRAVDHAEYPQTAEIEQPCIRMLASLFHTSQPIPG